MKKNKWEVDIDKSIIGRLRDYQQVAVRFILDRLTGKPFPEIKVNIEEKKCADGDSDDDFETPIVQRATRGDSSEKKRLDELGKLFLLS